MKLKRRGSLGQAQVAVENEIREAPHGLVAISSTLPGVRLRQDFSLQTAAAMSVFLKSAPLNRSGSPVAFASA